ncbi:MAG TPA: hypothetical protein VL401_02500 [Alphaproteobacteria bacterium]|jgi:hypothetical protein|nr:hypothetical protein [Alphaproteobacteria bacterium]
MATKSQEKKYQIDSFEFIQNLIRQKNLKKIREVTSVHYYGKKDGNDVEKIVVYPDRVEVHVWKNIDGNFVSVEDFKVDSEQKGLKWLKSRGFKEANIINMDYTEYGYEDGTIGLYTIDDFHKSAILNFPPNKHQDVEKVFGLQSSEVITVPYNKLMEKMGKLRTLDLL